MRCFAWLLASIAVPALAGPADDGRWHAGAYSFSDEMGGFRITDVGGSGTRDDPIVIEQDLLSASPVTLVIRATGTLQPYGRPGDSANGWIHLKLVTRNGSGIGWIEFEFELQEILGRPSVFGDGLSFDQRRSESGNITSSAFETHVRDFEPADRVLFQGGKIDPDETGDFGFLITDFTPVTEFYLVQDPRIPFS